MLPSASSRAREEFKAASPEAVDECDRDRSLLPTLKLRDHVRKEDCDALAESVVGSYTSVAERTWDSTPDPCALGQLRNKVPGDFS